MKDYRMSWANAQSRINGEMLGILSIFYNELINGTK